MAYTKKNGTRGRILVIDDEDIICETFRLFLGSEGYSVKTANSGREALECLAQSTIEVVILDILMPGMNGLEVMRKIRKKKQPPEIIVSTGAGSPDIHVEAMRLGAFDFLKKPILNLEEQLLKSVCRAIEHFQLKNTLLSKDRQIAALENQMNSILLYSVKLLRATDDAALLAVFNEALTALYPSGECTIFRATDDLFQPLTAHGPPPFEVSGSVLFSDDREGLPFSLPGTSGIYPLNAGNQTIGAVALGGLGEGEKDFMFLFGLLPALTAYLLLPQDDGDIIHIPKGTVAAH